MTWTVIQTSLRRLKHNRVELLLTFVVPIAFFSVFALIFGKGMGNGATPRVKVVIVDEAHTSDSEAIAQRLRSNAGLRLMSEPQRARTANRQSASAAVRRGTATIGIVISAGKSGELAAELLADASDQVAGQVVSALVGQELAVHHAKQAAARVAAQTRNQQQSLNRQPPVALASARLSGSGNPPVNQPMNQLGESPSSTADAERPLESLAGGYVTLTDVMGQDKANPVVSMYAAGIAVMFLLFGATGGGGALLEERENTTLDRLLSTQLTMDQLLLGKWFYLTLLGFVQVTVMFLWGQLVFDVDLLGHLDGFVMMTLVTSAAAAAFGLLLATLCKTRGQLNGLSVILILTMSALGGSMVPRYVMSEQMRSLGQWTFNAWALDGYDKVFWRDLPVDSLWPQLAVLMATGVSFLLIARGLATRWEHD